MGGLVIPVVVLLVVFGAVFAFMAPSSSRDRKGSFDFEEPWPLYAKRLMSPPEQILYLRLVQALPDNQVFAQVQLSRVLGVKKGASFQTWFNRINRLSADFVVCSKAAAVLAVIELDDSTHEAQDRKDTDGKKDHAFKSAGVPIIRWNVKAIPAVDEIRQHFDDIKIQGSASGTGTTGRSAS